jgi:peptidyl-tRNA hydrolase
MSRVGQWKLSLGKGPPLHGGLLSIEEHLKTKEFWRLRIGVDGRDPENRVPGIEYVLQNFVGDELARISREFPAMNEALDELRKKG